ncbi:hypothetical protein BH10ACI2_BH10ACI2_11940 [soil metagenome]
MMCLAFSTTAFSQAKYETDFKLFNETQFIVPITEKKDWNFILLVSGRLGNNVRTPTEARLGGMISKKITNHVTVGGGYIYRYSNPTFIQKRYEGRFIGWVTFTVPLSKRLTIVNRNQVQYENRFSRPNATVIRNRLWLKREVTVSKIKIEPFVSFESFYDTRLNGVARFRTQVGITHRFNSKFSADIFYGQQDETGDGTRPGNSNSVGTNFRVNF